MTAPSDGGGSGVGKTVNRDDHLVIAHRLSLNSHWYIGAKVTDGGFHRLVVTPPLFLPLSGIAHPLVLLLLDGIKKMKMGSILTVENRRIKDVIGKTVVDTLWQNGRIDVN
jgi:hypothetical protein